MRVRFAAAAVLALALIAGTALPAVAADGGLDAPETPLGISVKVLPPQPVEPTAPPAGGPTDAGAPFPSSVSVTPVAGGSDVATAPAAPVVEASDLEIAAGLYMSELRGVATPTLQPFEGASSLMFTLRNLSTDTIDGAAEFWLTSPLGAELGRERVTVAALKPGESRVVSARVAGSGQWLFVTANATFTPPAQIAGSEASPVTRSLFLPVFAWFLAILLVLAVAAVLVVRLVSSAPTERAAGVVA